MNIGPPARLPRKSLGVTGIVIGVSFVLIGVVNCSFVLLDLRVLVSNVVTFLLSAIFAFIGLAIIPLSLRFARNKSFSLKWITIGFLLYASVLTILSLTKTWQLDSDTILNAEVTIMIALVSASARFRGRFGGLLAGLPLLYIAVLLALVEGFSTSDILAFHTGLSLPSLGLLFSWRPFEVGALFLAAFASLARAMKKRAAPLAFLAMLSYSVGVLVPLLLPSSNIYRLLDTSLTNPSLLLLSASTKLLAVFVLLVGNVLATATAVAGLFLNRRSGQPPTIAAPSPAPRRTAGPPARRSYSDSY